MGACFLLAATGCGSGGSPGAKAGGTAGSGGGGVTSSDGVVIAPTNARVAINETVKFTCSVAGATAAACDWSVQEGASGGAIDADGLYTAPGTKGTYHVLAASKADSSKTASATVEVTPPRVTGDCSNLPAVGTWEQTAPQQLLDQSMNMSHQYGLIGLAVDPTNYATVYFGSEGLGIWKSTDCGGSWVHVNTGTHGSSIESGFQWSVAVDPVDSQVIYANSGYGADGSFLWRSANGGVDWDQFWPPADPTLADVVEYNFVHKVRIDPTDHLHLLVSFHANCKAPHTKACLAETLDGGSSWRIVDGQASWTGGEDQSVWFLDNSKTWLYGSQTNGLWRTADSGATWTVVNMKWGGHNGGQLYRAKDGTFYLAGPAGLLRSEDGVTWALDAKVPSAMCGITGDGTTMWAAMGPYRQSAEFLPYFTAEEANGVSWSQFTSPKLFVGSWDLGYNPDRNILYSSNGSGGFWRVVTK